MLSQTTVARLILFLFSLLAFSLAFTAIFNSFEIGPIRPAPDVFVYVNDEEYPTVKGPISVNVKKDEIVEVKVQIYYQGQLRPPGEFTYQWCFTPPVNHNQHCADLNFRTEVNSDYMPKNLREQKLEITINHTFLRILTIPISFKPEK